MRFLTLGLAAAAILTVVGAQAGLRPAGAAASAAQAGESIKCPVTRDAWLSAHPGEVHHNGGKAGHIKLKTWQEFGLLDFDVSALKGKRIESTTLHVAHAGGAVHGGDRGTDLRWFTVSTVSSPWEEGGAETLSDNPSNKGATFMEASRNARPWTVPGSRVYNSALGLGNSIRVDVDGGDPRGPWFTLPVDRRLVQALVAGAAHGFMIMDGSTALTANCCISSREGGNGAYLAVVTAGPDTQAPAPPANVSVKPSPADATLKEGAVKVSLRVPDDAFGYDIKLNGKPLPRWQIPLAAKAGSTQTFLIEYLPPDVEVKLEVAAVDAAGNVSAAATALGRTSPRITVPRLPDADFKPQGGSPPVSDGKLKVWAFPDICKLDPVGVAILGEERMEQAPSKNSVWDAGSRTVRVAAAKGEIAQFQLALDALKGAVGGLKIKVSGLEDIKVNLWRSWFVNVNGTWQGDYAIPLGADQALEIPAADNKVGGQKAASVAVDLIVPESAKPGPRTGTVSVTADGVPELKLTLNLRVFDVTIPREISFNPEMNCYMGPPWAGSNEFLDYHRLAHYHRSSLNRVTHTHSGNTHQDWVPAVAADGGVTDWTAFDRNLGPLLDGTAFKDNPRSGVPVPCLYLPHNETWPLPMIGNYDAGPHAPVAGENWIPKHYIFAKPPEQAFSPAYQAAFVKNVSDFVKHAEAKGWTRTWLQFYQNNKVGYNAERLRGTAWTMDEPFQYLDWHALKFFSTMFHKGTKDAKKTVFQYRGDISRPYWQGSCMDGLMEIMYCNGELFSMLPLIKEQKRRMPATIYCYGACNGQESSNHNTTAWCLNAYVFECDGVLPWQSLGEDKAFEVCDGDGSGGNALLVDGRRFGVSAVASFRVHAFRAGAQLVELLRLLEKKNGWGRGHSGAVVAQQTTLSAEFRQAFADDAAAVTFKGLNGDQFVRLKEGILKLLTVR